MNTDSDFIGSKLRFARNRLGYSQGYVGSQLNISQQAYGRLENEDQDTITWGRLKELTAILEMDMDTFLNLHKNPIYNKDIKDCVQVGNVNPVYQESNFDKERESYQRHIQDLNNEKEYLRQLIEKMLLKSQNRLNDDENSAT